MFLFWCLCVVRVLVEMFKEIDGPPVYVCNSDEFRGWQIGRFLEAHFSYSVRVRSFIVWIYSSEGRCAV